jgi:hypothetical protein
LTGLTGLEGLKIQKQKILLAEAKLSENPINLVNPVEKSPLRLSASAGNATLSFVSKALSNQKTDL